MVALPVSRLAAAVILFVGMIITLLSDTIFSICATRTFLHPITETLVQAQGQVHSQAFANLQVTRYMTLAGASLAVISSTLLYINGILFVVIRGNFFTSPWLNPNVFGVNLDSILNDIGLLLMSGILKQATQWSPIRSTAGWFSHSILKTGHDMKVAPEPLCFGSMADDE
jgi:hypothetical protein